MKKAEHWRIDAFELWCWRRLLRVPWTAMRSIQSILKETSPEYSLEALMLKLKLQYFGHLMQRTDTLEKILMVGKIEGGRRRGNREWDGWNWTNWLKWWSNWSILILFDTKFATGSLSHEHATPIFVVQLLNHVWIFVTLWTAACQASLSFTISQRLLKLMSIELVMTSNHLVLYHPLFLLPSIFPSMRVSSSESAFCIQFSSVTQLCLTLCGPMNCSTPGLPVHHNNINNMCVFSYNWVLDAAPLPDMWLGNNFFLADLFFYSPNCVVDRAEVTHFD